MLSITKLQNLKAIHNSVINKDTVKQVVINHKTTKFESNSQPLPKCSIFCNDIINCKTTKFESNSQPLQLNYTLWTRCYQSQNYKF